MLVSPGIEFMIDISYLFIYKSILFIELLIEAQTSLAKSPVTTNDPCFLENHTNQIIPLYVVVFVPVLVSVKRNPTGRIFNLDLSTPLT